MRKVIKKVCLIALGLSLTLTGCGKEQPVDSAGVELLEPVGTAGNYEAAARRTIYSVEVHDAIVYPYVEEYAFSEGVVFKGYAAYPGEEVSAGGALIYTDSETVDKQVKEMEEKIQTMQEEHEEYRKETLEALDEPSDEAERLQDILNNLKAEEPQTVSGSDASVEAYNNWLEQYTHFEGKYAQTSLGVEMQEVALNQRQQLYDLDMQYYRAQLADLKKKQQDRVLSTQIDGRVGAFGYYDSGNYINMDTTVVAVCDESRLELKCEFINKSIVSKAEDVFAYIDGKRHEVEYQVIETEEYKRLEAEGGKVFSTFKLADTTNIKAGDFGIIVIINDKREQALSVPKEAIHKDAEGYYVTVLQNDENVYVPVKTGLSDGVYTEILSGLSEGDLVQLDQPVSYGEKTVKVEYGNFANSFSANGFLFYPCRYAVKSPIEHGTMYFVQTQVTLYQHVEKGDVIATVRVEGDEVALKQNERKLQRLEERVADLRRLGEEDNAKEIEKKQEQIADLKELIQEIKADYAVTEIVASQTGLVIDVPKLEEDSLVNKDTVFATIADEANCYVVIDNEDQRLNYGNEVTINYKNKADKNCTAPGRVVLLSQAGVINQELKWEQSLIQIPAEAIGDMAAVTAGADGWMNRARFGISAEIRKMDNVLVVPRKAVKNVGGKTYVNVKQADGSVVTTSFVAGGSDDKNYWIVEGLTEGMEICYE